MAKKSILKEYEDAVQFSGMKINAKLLLLLTIIATIISVFIPLILPFVDFTITILLVLLVLDVGIGLPFYLKDKKIAKIESELPDVLHHIAITIKTGGTVETALKEASKVNYGPITLGLKKMLLQINEGKTFEEAFTNFSLESHSKLLEKAAIIIVAARKAGGGLLETLTSMAEDFRSLYRLQRERESKTFLQFLFIIVAGVFIAPFVFGIVKSVLQILVQVGGESTAATTALVTKFDTLFKVYLILQAALSSVGAFQVREGRISKAITFIPLAAIISYGIYLVVASQFIALLGAG